MLAYYFPAVRFEGDFMPALLLLATGSVGEAAQSFEGNKFSRTAYTILIALLALFSTTASVFISISPGRVREMLIFFKEIHKLLGF